MKLLHLIFKSLFVVIIISSCDNDSIKTISKNYFPLEVGNYWIFNSQKSEVIATNPINGHIYFTLKSGDYKSYYRVDDNKVYQSDSVGNETLYFDLTAQVNETWESGDWNITLMSKSATIEINEKKFTNCYVFFLDIPMAADDEHTITLAPNIGYIAKSCGFCPEGVNPYLEESKIGGKVTDY